MNSCTGLEAGSKEASANYLRDVTFSVYLPSNKIVILNHTDPVYFPRQLVFANKSDSGLVKYATIKANARTIITFFAVYMGNPSDPVHFHHTFFVKQRDTIFLRCTDSSDIKPLHKTDSHNFFAETIEAPFDSAALKLISLNGNNLQSYILKLKEIRAKSITNNSTLGQEQVEHLSSLCYFNYVLMVTKKFSLSKEQMPQLEPIVQEFATWLKNKAPYPNDLTSIFESIYAVSLNKEGCELTDFLAENKDLSTSDVTQGYFFQKLLAYTEKSSICWKNALDELKQTVFYQKNTIQIDSILNALQIDRRKDYISEFELKSASGAISNLGSLIKNRKEKYFLLDFWATWCGPCKSDMNYLKKIKHLINPNIGIISISLDEKEDFNEWKKSVSIKDSDNQQSYLSTGGFDSKICEILRMTAIPRYLIINKKGEVLDDDFKRPFDKDFIKKINTYQ